MVVSAGVMSNQPAAGPLVDLEQTAGVLPISAWAGAGSRNIHFTDVGTVTKRPGLLSHHVKMDDSTGPILAEAPPDYALGGLYGFRPTHNTGFESNIYVAKVNDYLVASQFGRNYDIPLAKGLGDKSHQAYFQEVYLDSARTRYLIVGSSNANFPISYWKGWPVTSGQSYDHSDWAFLRRVPWIDGTGYQFTVEHNQRLFVAGLGTTVLYSQSGNFLESAGQILLEPRWGRVTGFLPTYYGELLVGQERAISKVVFDTNPSSPTAGLPVAAETITTEYGLVGPNASARLGNDVVFMNTKGQITTVATTDRFGSLETGLLSKGVFRRFDDMPRAAWHHAWLEDDPHESILWIGHCRRAGYRNDSLSGWNYKVNQFEYVANEALDGFSCAAVMTTPRFGRPKIYIGTYATTEGASTAAAGRIFTFDPTHKEDLFLSAEGTDESGTSDEAIGDAGRVFLPGAASLGGLTTQAQIDSNIALTGTYTPFSIKTTIILRIKSVTGGGTGVIGTATNIVAEVYDVAEASRGSLTQDLGSGYTPDAAFDLTNGTDTGLNLALSALTVQAGQELFVHIHNRRKNRPAVLSSLRDDIDGLIISSKGSGTGFNMVSYVETSGVFFGDPHQDMLVDGITVVFRVTGNRADLQTDGPDVQSGQNQYRNMLDVYIKADNAPTGVADATWVHLAILDGNAAQRPHLDVCKHEVTSRPKDRLATLQHKLATSDTEATGTPMAKDGDVNVEYISVHRLTKILWLRFGQETGASVDRVTGLSTRGSWVGDFEIIGVHVHVTPQKGSAQVMSAGSSRVDIV